MEHYRVRNGHEFVEFDATTVAGALLCDWPGERRLSAAGVYRLPSGEFMVELLDYGEHGPLDNPIDDAPPKRAIAARVATLPEVEAWFPVDHPLTGVIVESLKRAKLQGLL